MCCGVVCDQNLLVVQAVSRFLNRILHDSGSERSSVEMLVVWEVELIVTAISEATTQPPTSMGDILETPLNHCDSSDTTCKNRFNPSKHVMVIEQSPCTRAFIKMTSKFE
jgi:hypothetical protein